MPETRYEVPPKLPVPAQADCFQSYLDDLSAIVPHEDWERARALVTQFMAKNDGLGPELHRKLEEHAQKVDNWVSHRVNYLSSVQSQCDVPAN